MNAKARLTLIVSFIVVILLFLLFSSMLIIWGLSNAGMMGSENMNGNNWITWMWIPTVLTLGLIFMIGWAIFSKNEEK